jgi:transposase-like protein
MSRPCSICESKARNEIDRYLLEMSLSGATIRGIARKFGVSEDALARHRDNHLQETAADIIETMRKVREEALEAIRIEEIEDIKEEVVEVTTSRLEAAISAIDKIRALQERTIKILDSVEAEDDRSSTLKAIKEVRENIVLEAKLTGEIQGDQVNVNTTVSLDIYGSPEWVRVGELLARILGPYPELRSEVAKELLALQETHSR